MDLPPWLDRHLRATYADHLRLEAHPFRADAEAMVGQAYPELNAAIEFVFLRSRRRHFEQHATETGGIIVVDEGLSVLAAFQDNLLSKTDYTPDHGLALALILYAEAFKAEGADDHALLSAAMIHERRSVLRDLHVETAQKPGRSALRHFFVLHEIAHFAVDTGASFTLKPLQQVHDAIEELIEGNRILLDRLKQTEDALEDLDVSFPRGASPERALMAQQTATYIEHIAGNAEIRREAGCDFIALLGFARLRLDAALDEGQPISPRELGDVLVTGLKACRLLVAKEIVGQTVRNIASRTDASELHPSFSELQMRSNLITRLAFSYFENMLTSYSFSAPTAGEDPDVALDPVRRFSQSVELLHRRSVERILTPIENIGVYHRDGDLFTADFSALQARLWGNRTPGPDAIEAAARDLIGRLPI